MHEHTIVDEIGGIAEYLKAYDGDGEYQIEFLGEEELTHRELFGLKRVVK